MGRGGYPSLGAGGNVWITDPHRGDNSGTSGENERSQNDSPRQPEHFHPYTGSDSPRDPFPQWVSGIFTYPHNKSARPKPRIGPNCDTVDIKSSGNHLGELNLLQFSPQLGLGRGLALCESAELPMRPGGNGARRLSEPGRGRKCVDYQGQAFETCGFSSVAPKLAIGRPLGPRGANLSPPGGGDPNVSKAPPNNPQIFALILVRVSHKLHFRCVPAAFPPIHTTKAPGSSPGKGKIAPPPPPHSQVSGDVSKSARKWAPARISRFTLSAISPHIHGNTPVRYRHRS